MTTTVVPINPREWQTRLWNDQTLWDDHMPVMVLAEMHERVWNVMDRDDEQEQVALLALKHGYVGQLEDYVADLEASDREMAKPPQGPRKAWVFDFPMESLLRYPDDAVATAVLPRVMVEPEPELEPVPVVAETAVQWVVPRGRKRRRK